MNRRRLLQRIMNGHTKNVRFGDLVDLIEGLGFEHSRTRGSHMRFRHPSVPDALNLQRQRGEAKDYQVRQLTNIVRDYDLRLEDT